MTPDEAAKLLHGYFDAIAAGKLEPSPRLTEAVQQLVNPTPEQKAEHVREIVNQMIATLKSLDRNAPDRAAEVAREAMQELLEFSRNLAAPGKPLRSKTNLHKRSYAILFSLNRNSRITSEQIASNVRSVEPGISDNTLLQHLSKLVASRAMARPEPGFYVQGELWRRELDQTIQKLREAGENLPKF